MVWLKWDREAKLSGYSGAEAKWTGFSTVKALRMVQQVSLGEDSQIRAFFSLYLSKICTK